MSGIKCLPGNTIRLLGSSQVITSIYSVVKELVENSLDAGASTINVTLEGHGLSRIEVRDNGSGIAQEDIDVVAKPHYTSKLTSTEDLAALDTYGFRGEALGSLCAVGDVTLTTRTAEEDASRVYVLSRTGDIVSQTPSHLPQGTTVCVTDLFKPLPVRRQYYTSTARKREALKHVHELIVSFALITPHVRYTLKHNKETLWQMNACGQPKAVLGRILGAGALCHLQHVQRQSQDPQVEVDLYLPVSGSSIGEMSRCSMEKCYTFVNSRPVTCKNVDKLLKQYYCQAHGITGSRYPVGLVHFRIPPDRIDVNVEPNKTTVFWHDKVEIQKFLEIILAEIYAAPEKEDSVTVSVPQQKDKCHDYDSGHDINTDNLNGQVQQNNADTNVSGHAQDDQKAIYSDDLSNHSNAVEKCGTMSSEDNMGMNISHVSTPECKTGDIPKTTTIEHNESIMPFLSSSSDGKIQTNNVTTPGFDVSIDLDLENIDFSAPFTANDVISSTQNDDVIVTSSDHENRTSESLSRNEDSISRNRDNVVRNEDSVLKIRDSESKTRDQESEFFYQSNPVDNADRIKNDASPELDPVKSHASWCKEQNTTNILGSSVFNTSNQILNAPNNDKYSLDSTNASNRGSNVESEALFKSPADVFSDFSNKMNTSSAYSGRLNADVNKVINSLFRENTSSANERVSSESVTSPNLSLSTANSASVPISTSGLDVKPQQLLHGHSTVLLPRQISSPNQSNVNTTNKPNQSHNTTLLLNQSPASAVKQASKRRKITPGRNQRDISSMLRTPKQANKSPGRSTAPVKSVTTTFDLRSLRGSIEHCFTQSSQTSQQQDERCLKLIGPVESRELWIGQLGYQLVCFQPIRMQEQMLYQKLLRTFAVPTDPLEHSIKLAASILQDSVAVRGLRYCECKAGPSQDPLIHITDARIVHNGFKLAFKKGSDVSQSEVVAMVSNIRGYTIQDLDQLLKSITNNPKVSLSQLRPKKVRQFLKQEAERMTRALPARMTTDEATYLAQYFSAQMLHSNEHHVHSNHVGSSNNSVLLDSSVYKENEDVNLNQNGGFGLSDNIAGGKDSVHLKRTLVNEQDNECLHGKPIIRELYDLSSLPLSQCD